MYDDDDYLLDDDDNSYLEPSYEELNEDEEDESDESDDGVSRRSSKSVEGKLSEEELKLSNNYDELQKLKRVTELKGEGEAGKDLTFEASIFVMSCIPKHTNSQTIRNIAKEMFSGQSHNRLQATYKGTQGLIRGEDVDVEYFGEDSTKLNEQILKKYRDHIAEFIGYLAGRDLSKDSIMSKRIKQRHIPAFIIHLFHIGAYDLILDCPTMPKEYDDQINNAIKTINRRKSDIIEDLALEYEKAGRTKVAERVRQLGPAWFTREPAELKTLKSLEDLDLTADDLLIYRAHRSKYLNVSKSLTQDVISDLILVVRKENGVDSGITEKLKDKTRGEAIESAKAVYNEWAAKNPLYKDMADRIRFNKTLI